MFDASTAVDADAPKADEPAGLDRASIRATGRSLDRLYRRAGVGGWARFLARHRGRICPLGRIAQLVPAGAVVLDVGCGRGALLALLALSGRASGGVGVDPSSRAIAQARAMAAALERGIGVRLCFHAGAAQRLTRADFAERFDVATIVDVMHHLPRSGRAAALANVAAAVKPGGVLIYKDMALRPLWRRLANKTHDLLLARQWIREEPIERVESWAERAGLSLEGGERIHMLWYAHELRVFRKPAGAGTEQADA